MSENRPNLNLDSVFDEPGKDAMPDWLKDSIVADSNEPIVMDRRDDDDGIPDWLKDLPDADERDDYQPEPVIESRNTERSVTPEYPGAPYEDEMMGSLHLGPELPGLMKQLEDPSLSDQEKQRITWEISNLHVKAVENNAWWDGNLNKRKSEEIAFREPINRPVRNEISFSDPVDHEINVEPVDEQTQIDVEPEEESQSGNRITRWLKEKIQGVKDFSEYTNRHRIESKALAFVGGFAGASSAVIGAEAAMIALSIPLTAGLSVPIGAAVGLGVNYLLFSKIMRKGIETEAKNEMKKYSSVLEGNREPFLRNIELDKKGRMKAFAYADVMAKLIGGTVLGGILSHHDVAPANTQELFIETPNSDVDTTVSTSPVEPTTDATVAPEIAQSPEVGVTVEQVRDYVVKASDNSWEQVLAQNNLETTGPDSIKALSMNRDNIVNMLTKWASTHGGNGTVPIEMGPDSVLQETPVAEVAKMLDEAIRNGYPTEELAKQDYAEYARQLANYERVTKWVLPGTHLQFPIK